jgi:ribosomal protein S16
MTLIIRLKKYFYLKKKFYSFVVLDKKNSVKSCSIKENLGFFNQSNNLISLNFYKLFYWLSKGVYISNSFYKLIFVNFFLKLKKKT